MPFDNQGRIVIPRLATVTLNDANLTNGVWSGGGTLALTGSSLKLRSHNPGEPVDILLVPDGGA